eukprot:3091-Pelagococcus_subviridis.AAC.3
MSSKERRRRRRRRPVAPHVARARAWVGPPSRSRTPTDGRARRARRGLVLLAPVRDARRLHDLRRVVRPVRPRRVRRLRARVRRAASRPRDRGGLPRAHRAVLPREPAAPRAEHDRVRGHGVRLGAIVGDDAVRADRAPLRARRRGVPRRARDRGRARRVHRRADGVRDRVERDHLRPHRRGHAPERDRATQRLRLFRRPERLVSARSTAVHSGHRPRGV